MANDPVCKVHAEAVRELLIKKRRSNFRGKNIKKKKTNNAEAKILAQDIAAALRVGAETPAPALPAFGTAIAPPVIQVPQRAAPFLIPLFLEPSL